LIRSASHSFYPRAGANPWERQIEVAAARLAAGDGNEAELRAAEDEVAALVVADQSRAFVDVVTDGLVRWADLVSHPVRALDGVAFGPRLVVKGTVRRGRPILVREFQLAREVGAGQLKMVLPGPVTVALAADDLKGAELAAFARDVAAAWAEEARDLAAAGCRFLQLDEPVLAARPELADLVEATAEPVFEAMGEGATTILSTYFGDLAAIADRAAGLPGTHLGLDLVISDANWEVVAKLPKSKGVALGLFDAADPEVEDAKDVADRMAPHRSVLEGRDVMVGPQAGLEGLPRDTAFDKLLHARYLAESLRRDWKVR
jgi:5-methyltetrahydropteroyltriglutamate--homocysteine methyltransferase